MARGNDVNAYSDAWFRLFLSAPDAEQTRREVAFLRRHLPRERFGRVLDACCGYGRHAIPLATAGYEVLGIDRDPDVIATAVADAGSEGPSFVEWPMERIGELQFQPDAVICMWQSFGYFTAAENRDVLAQISRKLPSGGRLVMDIYHRGFFETRQGTRSGRVGDVELVTTQTLSGDRLRVELDYGDGGDVFDWQVFTPEEFVTEVGRHGLWPVVACTSFDETLVPTADSPRMQFALERG
jgi:SAM-dependent methyltransferase